MEQSIKLLLDERPWMYKDELADFLYDANGVNVARTTVHNVLQRIKLTEEDAPMSHLNIPHIPITSSIGLHAATSATEYDRSQQACMTPVRFAGGSLARGAVRL